MPLLVDNSRIQSTAGSFRGERRHASTLVDSLLPTATQSDPLQDYILALTKEASQTPRYLGNQHYLTGHSAPTIPPSESTFDPQFSLLKFLNSSDKRLFAQQVFTGRFLNEVQQNAFQELENLRNLQPGWDQARAERINPRSIDVAQLFVCQMPTDVTLRPRVVPMTKGRLQLEWDKGPLSLELEFESPYQIHYLKWNSDEGLEEEDILIGPHDREKANDLINWFIEEASDV